MLNTSSSSGMETKPSLLQELRGFEKGGIFDLGHPLLNRIAESFVKAAGVLSLLLNYPLSLSLRVYIVCVCSQRRSPIIYRCCVYIKYV